MTDTVKRLRDAHLNWPGGLLAAADEVGRLQSILRERTREQDIRVKENRAQATDIDARDAEIEKLRGELKKWHGNYRMLLTEHSNAHAEIGRLIAEARVKCLMRFKSVQHWRAAEAAAKETR